MIEIPIAVLIPLAVTIFLSGVLVQDFALRVLSQRLGFRIIYEKKCNKCERESGVTMVKNAECINCILDRTLTTFREIKLHSADGDVESANVLPDVHVLKAGIYPLPYVTAGMQLKVICKPELQCRVQAVYSTHGWLRRRVRLVGEVSGKTSTLPYEDVLSSYTLACDFKPPCGLKPTDLVTKPGEQEPRQ